MTLERCPPRERMGFKGPRAAEWLTQHGLVLPAAPNSWMNADGRDDPDAALVARLGTAEFFLEDTAGEGALARLRSLDDAHPPGVYPVLREDAAFVLAGEAVDEVLSQVCNINFAKTSLQTRPLIMTLMIGVSVLVVPQQTALHRRFRIWCDPTFGAYLGDSMGEVVVQSGGRYTGVSA